jgi:hypothetical protein
LWGVGGVLIPIDYKRIARLGAWALLLLTAHLVWSPRSAYAGCNHLVTSQLTRDELSLLVEPLIGVAAANYIPSPTPSVPRPCQGLWCSGHPASPSGPPEMLNRGQFESWAWFRSVPDSDSIASFAVCGDASSPRPVQTGNDVFHPPRLVPSA